jgi:2-polyprenyl-6-hydroxyphenyl methylase/3-demethylubiquinone-9 3-methyltransferase
MPIFFLGTTIVSEPAFDFGENWKRFSERALDSAHFEQAEADFAKLMSEVPMAGQTFLDLGFGQGLALLAAGRSGAKVHGLDINPKCREVLLGNARAVGEPVPQAIVVGSILDKRSIDTIRRWAPEGFDIVYSWGALHHTGRMWEALHTACALVRPGGDFVLALYNRHWTSPCWSAIKNLYVRSPAPVRKALVGAFLPVIYLAKLIVTGRNPLRMTRGMTFYYDVVDWVGGYPYEYASRAEVEQFVSARGFVAMQFHAAAVPTGCNEFMFKRVEG